MNDLAAWDARALEERLGRLERTVEARLRRFARPTNLMTYEGTALDRLTYALVRRVWEPGRFEVICSVRPCMLPQLVEDVRAFAGEHGYPVADFKGDCSARFPWLSAEPRSCENVSRMISERLTCTGGLLISSALLNAENAADFEETNRSLSGMYVLDAPELARHADPSNGRDWRTLFLLRGFTTEEVMAGYLKWVAPDLGRRHFPLCYLDCYNERAQRRMIEALETFVPHTLDLLGRHMPSLTAPGNACSKSGPNPSPASPTPRSSPWPPPGDTTLSRPSTASLRTSSKTSASKRIGERSAP